MAYSMACVWPRALEGLGRRLLVMLGLRVTIVDYGVGHLGLIHVLTRLLVRDIHAGGSGRAHRP